MDKTKKFNNEMQRTTCEVTAECLGRTGVEMEALTATAVALLTVYDMCKAVDRGMRIENLRLLEKSGGKSGQWIAAGAGDIPTRDTVTGKAGDTKKPA